MTKNPNRSVIKLFNEVLNRRPEIKNIHVEIDPITVEKGAKWKIGHGWLKGCRHLEHVTFNDPQGIIKEVGSNWMSGCHSLTTVDFTSLGQLQTVGTNWMSGCRDVQSVDFTGLGQLQEVGGWWLWDCKALQTVHFTGLKKLQDVDHGWLSECTALTTVDFTALNQLQEVSNWWLFDCKSLTTVLFDNYTTFEKWLPKVDLGLSDDDMDRLPVDEERITKTRCNSLAAIARMKGTYSEWDDIDVGGPSGPSVVTILTHTSH